jgi:hypothetical protein
MSRIRSRIRIRTKMSRIPNTVFLRPSLINAYLIVVFGYFTNVVEGVLAAVHPGWIKYSLLVAGLEY